MTDLMSRSDTLAEQVSGEQAGASPFAGLRSAVDTVIVTVTILALWQVLHWIAGTFVLPSPAASFAHLGALLANPGFIGHLKETATAFGLALVIALAGGLGVGVLLGAHRLSGEVAEPILIALYSIPKVTLYPVVLLIFGLGLSSKIAFGAIHGIIPVVIFSMNAVRNMHPVYLRTARVMRLGPWQTAWRVVLPATVPEVVSGFRIGFALTLLGTLIGELFASSKGIGFLLMRAMGTHDVETIMAIAILLFVFAVVVSSLLLKLDTTLHHRS